MLSVIVIAIGFTYAAYKTRSLVAGIVFHYVRDALLFFVQLPDGVHNGPAKNVAFHGLLWLGVGVGCLITKAASERLGARAPADLYERETGRPNNDIMAYS